jgi:hypothetical protein
VAAGDLDADGDLDLVTGSIGSDKVGVSLNNGAGGFGAVGHYSAGGNPAAVALGDFTGDGKLDVAAGNEYNTLSVLPGRGDGMLSLWINFGVGGGTLTGVAAGDFNGDGWLDVATASNNFLVSVLLNDSIWDGLPPPPVPPTLRIGDVSLTEGNSGTRAATFTVTLSAPSAYPVTVQYATANGTAAAGSDYQAWSGILSIPAGSTTGTITVPVIGDRLPEPNETFTVNLSSPTNATIDDGQGIGTILDNEPRISISDVSKTEGNGKKSTLFTFTVTLSAAYDQPVTVSFQTVNGTATTGDSDYVARTGMLTFAPGETTKTITIDVKSDRKTEADEYFYLDLSGNSSNSLFIKSRGLGTILNDD